MTRAVECEHDKAFVAALDEGADPAKKKLNARLRKDFHESIASYPAPSDRCDYAERENFQYTGFLAHWEILAAMPDAATSCAALGAAINKAGGLPGGDTAD